MEKQVIVVDIEMSVSDRNTICYVASGEDPAIDLIYVYRTHLGKTVPENIKLTLEEVD